MANSTKFVLLSTLFLANHGMAQSSNLELDALLIESSDLMQSGQAENALALLKRYEEDYSAHPEFLNNLAVAYLGTADPVAAVTILRQLVDSDPVFSIVAHNLIELEMQSAEGPPETINPVLFVQSTQSFFEAEMENIEAINIAEASSEPSIVPARAAPAPISTHLQILRDALEDQTLEWAADWSAKDLEAYLNHYAADFLPADATSAREWRISRSVALNKPGDILVEISDFDVFIDGNIATARFEQRYESSNYADRVEKTLVYSYLGDSWKISSETSIPIE
jgi:ketosteroid isomerase-like protein